MKENTPRRVGAQEQFGRISIPRAWSTAPAKVCRWSRTGRPGVVTDGPLTSAQGRGSPPLPSHPTPNGWWPPTSPRPCSGRHGPWPISGASPTWATPWRPRRTSPSPTAPWTCSPVGTAAHHFQDLGKAVAEWHRVLAPEAVLPLADTSCPEDAATADWMNDIEERRDPSHVRNLAPSEWLAHLEAHGFRITHNALAPVPLEFDDWVRRSGTPASVVQGLRRDFVNAPSGAVEAFGIRQDERGSIRFQWSCVVVRAVRRA